MYSLNPFFCLLVTDKFPLQKGVMTLTALEVTPAASAEVTTTPSALGATLVASVAAVSPI